MAAGSVALPSGRYLLLHLIVLTVAVEACACSVFFLLIECSQGEPETRAWDFCVSWSEYVLLGLGPSWLRTGLASSGGRRLKIEVGGTASSLGECDPVSPHVGEQDNNSCSIQSRKNNTQCPTNL